MSIALLLLGAIFGVRPLILAAEGDWLFTGVDVRGGAPLAATVGLWATVAICGGYALGAVLSSLRAARDESSVPVSGEVPARAAAPLTVSTAAMVSLLSTAVWFIAMAAIGGGIGFLAQLAEGRSAEIARRLEGVPVVVSAIPVAGMVLLAVARIYTVRERTLRVGERIWFWGAFAFAMVPPLALGNRRLLLPVAIVALLSLAATGWRRRVSVLTVLIILAGALIVAAIPFVRSAGSRATSPDLVGALAAYFGTNGLEDTARSFFVSYDTEMFSYIALVGPQLGGAIEWGMGRGSLGEAALQFLPASVAPWPTWSNQILTQVYGGGCGTVACPVPSIAGVLFFDTGLIGVVIGMFLFGLVIQRFEGAFQVAVGPRLVALLALGGFMPGIIRGNSVSQLWITLNVIVIALLLLAAAAGARRLRGGLLSRNRRVKPTRVAASAVNSWAGR